MTVDGFVAAESELYTTSDFSRLCQRRVDLPRSQWQLRGRQRHGERQHCEILDPGLPEHGLRAGRQQSSEAGCCGVDHGSGQLRGQRDGHGDDVAGDAGLGGNVESTQPERCTRNGTVPESS